MKRPFCLIHYLDYADKCSCNKKHVGHIVYKRADGSKECLTCDVIL